MLHKVHKLRPKSKEHAFRFVVCPKLRRVGHFPARGLLLYRCAMFDSCPQAGTTCWLCLPLGATRETPPCNLATRTWRQRRATGGSVSRGIVARPGSEPACRSVGVVDVVRSAFGRSPGSPACGRKSSAQGAPRGGPGMSVPLPLLLMNAFRKQPVFQKQAASSSGLPAQRMFQRRKTSKPAVVPLQPQHTHLEGAAIHGRQRKNLQAPPA